MQASTYYPLSPRLKGKALLINNHNFLTPAGMRLGSEHDVNDMTRLLEHLGYQIKFHPDLSGRAMLAAIKDFLESDVLNWFNQPICRSCIVVVMTHGVLGWIGGVDGIFVEESAFLEPLSRKGLSELPKIFILNACRNDEDENQIPIPLARCNLEFPGKNTFVLYASVPGSTAYRIEVAGGWFIQILRKIFRRDCHDADANIQTLFNRVRAEMETLCTSAGQRQRPMIATIGIGDKKFHFFPDQFVQNV